MRRGARRVARLVPITGQVRGDYFNIEVDNGIAPSRSSLTGTFGNATPTGVTRFGCVPVAGPWSDYEMFLVNHEGWTTSGSWSPGATDAFTFFRPMEFPGVVVGKTVSC